MVDLIWMIKYETTNMNDIRGSHDLEGEMDDGVVQVSPCETLFFFLC